MHSFLYRYFLAQYVGIQWHKRGSKLWIETNILYGQFVFYVFFLLELQSKGYFIERKQNYLEKYLRYFLEREHDRQERQISVRRRLETSRPKI